ncbi:hypothetical protein A6279_24950 [Bacillus wiedmannii]|nr:hypothetical protein A6278_25375 [Bacillus wiedmannii]OAK09626.1 hypothetical protein A6279_24950 [Bacillus wiedmannii]SEG81439.1 PD-(D/E)XK nuclease family transposase [Bacillus sp. ok061]
MSTKLVNLRIDFAFKQLFGTKGNEEILTGFLNAILEESLDVPIVIRIITKTLRKISQSFLFSPLNINSLKYFPFFRQFTFNLY